MGMNAMSEEDPFAVFKNSSPLHAAIITPGGELIIAVPVSGDEEALMAFQSSGSEEKTSIIGRMYSFALRRRLREFSCRLGPR